MFGLVCLLYSNCKKMNKNHVLGIVRHVLAGIGVWLSTTGLIDESAWEALGGAVMTLVGVIWSVVSPEKKGETNE